MSTRPVKRQYTRHVCPPDSPGCLKTQDGSDVSSTGVRDQINNFFCHFASQTARYSGSSFTFAAALGIILVWAMTGPLFRYSDTWQLVINTGTTIVTFLMVFLIQNTQNRDSEALHLKIDELIRASHGAQNALINLEDMTQEELDVFKEKFAKLAQKGHGNDTGAVAQLVEDSITEAIQQESNEAASGAEK